MRTTLAGVALIFSCMHPVTAQEPIRVIVFAYPLQDKTQQVWTGTFSGTDGQLARPPKKVGECVKKGESLLSLEYVPTRTARNMAAVGFEKWVEKALEIQHKLAEKLTGRGRILVPKDALSIEEMEKLESDLNKSHADIHAQKDKIKVAEGDATPYEPEASFPGKVTWVSRKLVIGFQMGNVLPPEKVLEVADLSAGMEARIPCDADTLLRITKVTVRHVRTGRMLSGAVGNHDYADQTLSVTFENPQEVIRPGERVEVTLTLSSLDKK